MKIGDRVRVNCNARIEHGKSGIITSRHDHPDGAWHVKLAGDRAGGDDDTAFFEKHLILISPTLPDDWCEYDQQEEM